MERFMRSRRAAWAWCGSRRSVPHIRRIGHIGTDWYTDMKLVTFSTGSDQRVGVVDTDRGVVRDVSPLLPDGTGVLQLIERWPDLGPGLAQQAAGQPEQPLDGVQLLAPIP